VDNCGNTASHTFEDITIDNTAPTVTGPIAPATIACIGELPAADSEGALSAAMNMATDNCYVDRAEWVSDVPAMPTVCPATIVRTYRVFDCAGNSATVTQTITLDDNEVPTWTTPTGDLDRTCLCGDPGFEDCKAAALALAPVGSDNCTPTVTLVSTVTLADCGGSIRRTWSVSDGCGNTSTVLFTQTISIVDNAPPTWTTLVGALDMSVECSNTAALAAAQALVPVANDNCDMTLTPVKTAGTFVAGGFCPQEGTYTNTWVVTDDCGNTSTSFTQVITITDNTAPTWTTVAGTLDRTVACNNPSLLVSANALAPTEKRWRLCAQRRMPHGRHLHQYLDGDGRLWQYQHHFVCAGHHGGGQYPAEH
jgi:large repetitive protein